MIGYDFDVYRGLQAGIIAVLRFFQFKCAEQWADVAVRREVKGGRRRWQVRSSLFPACPANYARCCRSEFSGML